ncbi:MAG: universal stress protein [Rubrivivax sp.]
MNTLRSLVLHMDEGQGCLPAFDLATALTLQWQSSLAVSMAAGPVHPVVGLSAESASLAHQLRAAQMAGLRSQAQALATRALQRGGPGVEWRYLEGEPDQVLVAQSRTADLLIATQADEDAAGGLSVRQATRLLVGAACPVLMVPHTGWDRAGEWPSPIPALGRVMVAWSDTRESARALRDAMPLLLSATRVELVTWVGDDGASRGSRQKSLQAVATYLSGHGIDCTLSILTQHAESTGARLGQGWVPDVTAAEALLSHAADMNADVMVMGCYGHARLWEWVLGGVSRTILSSMTLPVFLSH